MKKILFKPEFHEAIKSEKKTATIPEPTEGGE